MEKLLKDSDVLTKTQIYTEMNPDPELLKRPVLPDKNKKSRVPEVIIQKPSLKLEKEPELEL